MDIGNLIEANDILRRIEVCRFELHAAIRRIGSRPLYQCPEVLALSRKMDALINQAQAVEARNQDQAIDQ